jgi:hypothetical protein
MTRCLRSTAHVCRVAIVFGHTVYRQQWSITVSFASAALIGPDVLDTDDTLNARAARKLRKELLQASVLEQVRSNTRRRRCLGCHRRES